MTKLRDMAVIGAGPAGLALGLLAAELLPDANVTLFDARALEHDVSGDPRVLALALGSIQLLQRLKAWPEALAQSILEVQVSQAPPGAALPWGEPRVRLSALEQGVPRLGAVLSYGALVTALQRAWTDLAAARPQRLRTRFGAAVSAIKPLDGAVEVDAGIAERFDLAVIAEGGVFAEQKRRGLSSDYGQTAWIGTCTLDGAPAGLAIERFTRHGPVALLPLPPGADGRAQAALVCCVNAADDPVRALDDEQRMRVLNSVFVPPAGRIVALSPLKDFALGLNAERMLVDARTVRIGNAAQTLHPVAAQGLNLGLRDAFELADALRRRDDVDAALRGVEWSRAGDRWAMIAATDFLARSFTWTLPGLPTLRALALSALDAAGPLKSALARHMMFGRR